MSYNSGMLRSVTSRGGASIGKGEGEVVLSFDTSVVEGVSWSTSLSGTMSVE